MKKEKSSFLEKLRRPAMFVLAAMSGLGTAKTVQAILASSFTNLPLWLLQSVAALTGLAVSIAIAIVSRSIRLDEIKLIKALQVLGEGEKATPNIKFLRKRIRIRRRFVRVALTTTVLGYVLFIVGINETADIAERRSERKFDAVLRLAESNMNSINGAVRGPQTSQASTEGTLALIDKIDSIDKERKSITDRTTLAAGLKATAGFFIDFFYSLDSPIGQSATRKGAVFLALLFGGFLAFLYDQGSSLLNQDDIVLPPAPLPRAETMEESGNSGMPEHVNKARFDKVAAEHKKVVDMARADHKTKDIATATDYSISAANDIRRKYGVSKKDLKN